MMQATSSPDNQLALRFQGSRPGWDLVAIVDAAIPVTLVSADVLAQDRKKLPPLDEFILRFLAADVVTVEDLTGLLGLPEAIVTDAIAGQLSSDNIAYRHHLNRKTLALTGRGRVTARELASVSPVNVELPLIFDRLLWRIRPYDDGQTISRSEAQRDDVVILPELRPHKVATTDITAAEINSILQTDGLAEREVLVVKGVRQRPAKRFMSAKLMVFADASREEVQLAVVVDDELSQEHEMALLSLGGASRIGIKAEPAEPRPLLSDELESLRVPLEEVTRQQAESLSDGQRDEVALPVDMPEVRGIGVFEHPGLLDEALTQASRRVLIVSPWIKRNVVNTSFLGKLEQRLRRNVSVHIAYGIDPGDPECHEDAVRKLSNLAGRYPDRFTFTRLRRTHAKVLIYDDVWITTSFNWLSFQGSADRTYRMEEGTLVRSKELVDENYQKYLSLIAQHRLTA
ncbi:hypothetical protein O7608_29525 [Solwaraspora sp. WMMA2056]|uniref:hypothetical protein n=1 Tax=Solwaraspora sp. WMMA2056 TaxID=3015161 RepID=UPI00259BA85D|nr:hypothetical protein [Solwaraspora sp. WMMA2056]WJK40486.1 hypothetical protein O7608_29525 [Solwaraspora sp. WMMA2056]